MNEYQVRVFVGNDNLSGRYETLTVKGDTSRDAADNARQGLESNYRNITITSVQGDSCCGFDCT